MDLLHGSVKKVKFMHVLSSGFNLSTLITEYQALPNANLLFPNQTFSFLKVAYALSKLLTAATYLYNLLEQKHML